MNRRNFIASLGLAPALAPAQRRAASDPPVMGMTPGQEPTIVLIHLGLTPKILIVRLTGRQMPSQFTIRDISFLLKPFNLTAPLKPAARGDFGDHRSVTSPNSSVSGSGFHLFKSGQDNIECLERTGGCPLNNFLFGKLTRSFGYSGLSGKTCGSPIFHHP